MKLLHIFILALSFLIVGAVNAQAQSPVNIRAVGDITIGSSVPVTGTVTTTLCTSATCSETVTQGTAGATGWPIVESACSSSTCYTVGVATGATVIASAATSTIFAQTTLLQSMHCVNILNSQSAGVTLNLTDGANNLFLPAAMNIPVNGFYDLPPGLAGSILTSGVKASAGTASGIQCWFTGKQ